MDDLREALKQYMAEKDLTLADIGSLLDRCPSTIWSFLRGKTKPHFQTLYRIAHLIEKSGVKNGKG